MGYFGMSALDEMLYNDPKAVIIVSIVQREDMGQSSEAAAAKAMQEAREILAKRPHTPIWAFGKKYLTPEDAVEGIRSKYGIK